ncbi:MAG: ChaN family lipoprotein [Planctomycetes bacterium]|nr:ChaN family lipoprotein [Planctomycetota bacterium]
MKNQQLKFVVIICFVVGGALILGSGINVSALNNVPDNIRITNDPQKLHRIGVGYLQTKQYDEAAISFRKIINLSPKNAAAYYNLACAYSLNQKPDQAIDSLTRAVELGYRDFDLITTDPDLKNIRPDKRYETLLKTLPAPLRADSREEKNEQQKAIDLIEKTRGLKFKAPLTYRVLPPGEQKLHGLYNPRTKILYVKKLDNRKRAFGVLIHESFHGWQDQHFGLIKLRKLAKNTDASYAIKALLEGDATYLTMACLPESKMSRMLTIPPPWTTPGKRGPELTKLCLKSFDYSVGAKFIQTIKKNVGWAGVNKLYENPPRSTEQILHPEKYLKNTDEPVKVTLPPVIEFFGDNWQIDREDTTGEFVLMLILIQQGVPGPTAAAAAAGWGGDSLLTLKHGREQGHVWKTIWDTEQDTIEFFVAAQKMMKGYYPGITGTEKRENGHVTISYRINPNRFALLARQNKSVIILRNVPENGLLGTAKRLNLTPTPVIPQNTTSTGPLTKKDKTIAALRQMSLKELYGNYVDLTTNDIIDFTALMKKIKNTQVIYVAETHDNVTHHQIQLDILRALHKNNPDVAMGMEFLRRPMQTVVDSFSAQKITYDQLTPKIKDGFGNDLYPYYTDLLKFASENKVKLLAINVPHDVKARFMDVGWENLTVEEKKMVARDIDTSNKRHKKYVIKSFQGMLARGIMKANNPMINRFYYAQCVWDETMAESIANYLKQNSDRASAQLMIVAGLGHIEYKFNIPQRAFRRKRMTYQTVVPIEVNNVNNIDFRELFSSKIADFIVFTKPRNR